MDKLTTYRNLIKGLLTKFVELDNKHSTSGVEHVKYLLLDFGVFQILFYPRTRLDINLKFDFIRTFHRFPFSRRVAQNG